MQLRGQEAQATAWRNVRTCATGDQLRQKGRRGRATATEGAKGLGAAASNPAKVLAVAMVIVVFFFGGGLVPGCCALPFDAGGPEE